MCIFHQFCSIFDVFIRIDNSVLSFSTCYIHIDYIHIYICKGSYKVTETHV